MSNTSERSQPKNIKENSNDKNINYNNIYQNAGISICIEDFSEVKKKIDALRKNGVNNFNAYIDENPEFLNKITNTIQIVDVNTATIELYEAEHKEQLLGKLDKILLPEAATFLREVVLAFADNKSHLIGEAVNQTLKGKKIYVELTMTIPTCKKDFRNVVLVIKNISDKKIIEEKHSSLINTMTEGFAVLSKDKLMEFVNEKLCKMLQYTSEELIGKSPLEIMDNNNQEIFMKEMKNRVKGIAEPYEISWKRKDGINVATYVSPKILMDENGNFNGALAVITDISKLKESLKNLEELKERYALALKTNMAGLWDWNIETGDVVFDERWAEMLGYTLDEVEPNVAFWEKIVHPDDMAGVMEVLTTHLEGKSEIYQTEHRCKTKNGEWKWILDTGKVVDWNNEKKPLRAVGTHIDITEKKEMEEMLVQSEKLASLGQLSAGLSHKLRNPLAIISSTAQMGMNKVDSSTPIKEILDVINRNALEANKMVFDLLNFAKPRELIKKKYVLRQTLDKAYGLIKGDFTKNNIQFNRKYSHSRIEAVYDEDSIIEVILNLYMNAIQEMKKGGIISTTVLQKDGEACIDIEDNGPGINKKYIKKVFDPFFTTKNEGTGLGLSLCHRIMNQQNGLISINSNEGKGTSISLYLPLSTQEIKTELDEIHLYKGIEFQDG